MKSEEIIKAMEHSTSAYRYTQPYAKIACTAAIDDKQSGVQCFLRKNHDTLWITFRGSDSLKDWLSKSRK